MVSERRKTRDRNRDRRILRNGTVTESFIMKGDVIMLKKIAEFFREYYAEFSHSEG